MPVQFFLNERSVPHEEFSRPISVGFLKSLVSTIRAARRIDKSFVFNSHVPLANLPLSADETMASVRNDGECVEESIYLKTVINRAPFDTAALESDGDDPRRHEYKLLPTFPVHPNKTAVGLGFAHLFEGVGLSIASHDSWNNRRIPLKLQTIEENGEIHECEVEVLNVYSPQAIEYFEDFLREALVPELFDGRELWARRGELLPNLVFIPRTKAQLEGIKNGDPMLKQVWTKLSGIDQSVQVWKATKGPSPMYPFNVRPESKSRLKLTKFFDNNRQSREFSDHCDLAPNEWRLHFIVESKPLCCAIIGHIGRKLGIG